MDREQLKTILPHREPMLLLDSSEVVDGIACGTYKVRGDEFFLQGHFPGNPVVPGVILCEMMAQNCCVLVGAEATQGKDTFYTSMDKIRFKPATRARSTLPRARCSWARTCASRASSPSPSCPRRPKQPPRSVMPHLRARR